jgi:hypothetical protein
MLARDLSSWRRETAGYISAFVIDRTGKKPGASAMALCDSSQFVA